MKTIGWVVWRAFVFLVVGWWAIIAAWFVCLLEWTSGEGERGFRKAYWLTIRLTKGRMAGTAVLRRWMRKELLARPELLRRHPWTS